MFKQLLQKSTSQAGKIAHVYKPSNVLSHGWAWRIWLFVVTVLAIILVVMFFLSDEPETITAQEAVAKYLPASELNEQGEPKKIKTGAALTAMTIHVTDVLVNKKGGYLRNDITPPGIIMDNIPAWEYGVLVNLRDISKVFRNNFSTSGSQTKRDEDLGKVENNFSIDSKRWMLPSPEQSYNEARDALKRFLVRINDEDETNAQFNARADNLRHFLNVTSQNLGSYSQRLSESVGVKVENLSLAGDSSAEQTTKTPDQLFSRTPWHLVDDNFYEARGYTWALLQEVRAIELDFAAVLKKKNATAYVKQLMRELEATQQNIWSPMIMNGNGFGMVTNHSLVMASYLTRANAIIIELSDLLERG